LLIEIDLIIITICFITFELAAFEFFEHILSRTITSLIISLIILTLVQYFQVGFSINLINISVSIDTSNNFAPISQ